MSESNANSGAAGSRILAPQESILEEAQRLIHGERNVAYGHPRDNFAAIAAQWNAYLDHMGDRQLNSLDVANLMILMKVARVVDGVFHRDSYTDIAGYAGTGERLQEPVIELTGEPQVMPGAPDYMQPVEEPLTIEHIRWLTVEPRVFRFLNENVPDNVTTVRDAQGDLWQRHPQARWACGNPRKHLSTAWVGPFTEVLDG